MASAFLPLSLVHIPELLQKNALGMLLLAVFIFLSKRAITAIKLQNTILLILTFVLILITHYGSIGVTFLYLFSILIASLLLKKKPKHIRLYGGITTTALILSITFIYFIDIQRYERILFYIQHSFKTSFLGLLFSANADVNQKLMAVGTIIIPALVTILFYKLYYKSKESISEENRLFWLSNIIFCYLLILPIYDQLLFGRLTLFTSFPILFISMFILTHSINKNWLKKGILIFIILGTVTMAFGEFFGLKFHNRNKNEIYNDLMTITENQKFHHNDLIITKYGAEHICIWFLKTKSGVITSLNLKDFNNYENIYILNPIEGTLNYEGIKDIEAINDANKYTILLKNIPKPKGAKTIYESEHIQLLLLKNAPEEWKYDDNGNWIGYNK
jgi:hypothetical protein